MSGCCKALGCGNTRTNSNLHFYRFPKDATRCNMWVERSGNTNLRGLHVLYLYTSARLCSRHFPRTEFTNETLKKLNRNALPSIFNHEQTEVGLQPCCNPATYTTNAETVGLSVDTTIHSTDTQESSRPILQFNYATTSLPVASDQQPILSQLSSTIQAPQSVSKKRISCEFDEGSEYTSMGTQKRAFLAEKVIPSNSRLDSDSSAPLMDQQSSLVDLEPVEHLEIKEEPWWLGEPATIKTEDPSGASWDAEVGGDTTYSASHNGMDQLRQCSYAAAVNLAHKAAVKLEGPADSTLALSKFGFVDVNVDGVLSVEFCAPAEDPLGMSNSTATSQESCLHIKHEPPDDTEQVARSPPKNKQGSSVASIRPRRPRLRTSAHFYREHSDDIDIGDTSSELEEIRKLPYSWL